MSPDNALHRLPVVGEGQCERHPRDGWVLAEPFPMSKATERALFGLVEALLPPAPAPRPAGIEARVVRHVRRMLAYMPRAMRFGLQVLVHILDWSPVWRLRSFSRVQTLDPQVGSRLLSEVAQSRFLPIRLLMLAPKAVVLSTYYDQDEVHAALGYAPRAFLLERMARRDTLLALEAEAEAPAYAEVKP
jgi:hypothetical protein